MSCYQCFYIKIHWCFYDGEKSYFLLYSLCYACLFCIWGVTEKNGLCWSHALYALSRLQRTSIFSVFLLIGVVSIMFWFCFVVWLWMLCLFWWSRKKKEGYDALIRQYFRRWLSQKNRQSGQVFLLVELYGWYSR